MKQNYELSYLCSLFPVDETELFVYGAGLWGKLCAAFLSENLSNISATFVDEKAKDIQKLLQYSVITPEEFFQKGPTGIVILAVSGPRENLFGKLLSLGYEANQIFCFSGADPKKTLHKEGNSYACSLQSAREWSLGLYDVNGALRFATPEIYHGIFAEFPPIQSMTLEENQMFSLAGEEFAKGTPKLSVIVPVFGVEDYLDRCVQSLVNQSYKNLEILLIDDGGTDRCPEICDKWATLDPRIRVFHRPHAHTGVVRNFGMKTATGNLVPILTSFTFALTTLM